MPTFLYTGINENGYISTGAKKFKQEAAFINYLNRAGISDYSIFESKTDFGRGIYSLVSCSELSLFCKQMAVVLTSQLGILEGIQLLILQSDNKTLKIALDEMYDIIDQGFSLSQAISLYTHLFPTHLIYMVIVGEQSGTMDKVFEDMSDYYAKEAKQRKKLKRAVAYPAMLSILMAALILLLLARVLPVFSDILAGFGAELPASTVFILGVGNFFGWLFWLSISIIALAGAGFIYYVKTDRGRLLYDRLKLNSPFTKKIYRRIVAAKISKSLAILIRSGVSLINAVEIITPLADNKYVEDVLLLTVGRLSAGEDVEDVFSKIVIFPSLLIKMITVGQKTGKLPEMLLKAQTVFDDEADDAIERITTMVEPIMIIILSVIVGIILVSVMLPIINLMAIIA